MASEESVVEVKRLKRRFGKLVAVNDVSFRVKPGEVFGVLGPNGAGKSTLIRMLCGLLDPSDGSAIVAGFDVAKNPDEVKQRIGYMTQRFSLYEDLSVEENLEFYAALYGVPRVEHRARIEAMLKEGGLVERRGQLAGTLSGGWKQRLALACATVHRPELVFLDEPTAGVDPVSRREFWERIHELSQGGTTLIVTTHYMDEAERCHRLCFIFGGRLLKLGSPREIAEGQGLNVAEVEVDPNQVFDATKILSGASDVEECAHFGNVIRLVTRDGVEPEQLCRELLTGQIEVVRVAPVRSTVEDAFVALVRELEP